jgi:hypothetical protein
MGDSVGRSEGQRCQSRRDARSHALHFSWVAMCCLLRRDEVYSQLRVSSSTLGLAGTIGTHSSTGGTQQWKPCRGSRSGAERRAASGERRAASGERLKP